VKLSKTAYKNLGLKIFSLFLTIIIWLFVNGIVRGGPTAYKDIKNIEVRLMGEPLFLGKNVFSVDVERRIIDLRVKGPIQEIDKITRMDVIAYVDVSNLRPGRTYSPVINVILPENIEIVGAPPLVRVEIKDMNL